MNIVLFNSFVYINLLFDLFNEAEKSLEFSHDYYLYIGISVIPYVVSLLFFFSDDLVEESKRKEWFRV